MELENGGHTRQSNPHAHARRVLIIALKCLTLGSFHTILNVYDKELQHCKQHDIAMPLHYITLHMLSTCSQFTYTVKGRQHTVS